MEGASAIVLFVVVGVAAVAAVWALVISGSSHEEIGRGGMSIGDERPPPAPDTSARELEIRQMLEARTAIRRALREEPHDVDARVRELVALQADPERRAEVRELVEATNARRAARSEEPLDVEAEIDRQLHDLGGAA